MLCAVDDHCGPGEVCAGQVCRQQCSSAQPECPEPLAAGFYGREAQICDQGAGHCVDPGACGAPHALVIGQTYTGASAEQNSSMYRGYCRDGSGEVFWGGGEEVVYSFVSPADGPACFRLTEATYDAVLYLKTECATQPNVTSRQGFLSAEACVDAQADGGSEALESLAVNLVSGQRYFLFIDARELGEAGTFTLETQYGDCP